MAGSSSDPLGNERPPDDQSGKPSESVPSDTGSPSDPQGNTAGSADKIHSAIPRLWYALSEVASLLGVGERRVRQILHELGVEKISGRYLLTSDTLDMVLGRRHKQRGGTSKMGRIAAKSVALDATLRIGKRVDDVLLRMEKLERDIWAVHKLSAGLFDQINDLHRWKSEIDRERIDLKIKTSVPPEPRK